MSADIHAQDLLEALGEALIVVDAEDRVVYRNEAVDALWDGEAPSPGALLAVSLPADLQGILEMTDAVRRTGDPARRMLHRKTGGESARRVFVGARPYPAAEDGTACVLLRLSDTNDLYETLMQGLREEKMASVGLLAAGVAHEFNNIWASVYGYAELALHEKRFTEELVQTVLEQSDRAMEILHALLSFSHQYRKGRESLKLRPILQSIIRLSRLEMRAKGIEVVLNVEDDPLVEGQKDMLQQAFLHLIVNAYQAIPDKGRVEIGLLREGDRAVVRVCDTGVGMTPDQVHSLFDPFFTTKGAFGGNASVDGRGLGLTLTYNFIRIHEGTVDVETQPGEGSVFTVRLPVSAKAGASSATPLASRESMPHLAGLRVLVVEDDPHVARLLASVLTDRGCVHEVVSSGEEALEKSRADGYDVYFLDLVLDREISGFDVAEVLFEEAPGAAVFLMTGHPDDPRLGELEPHVSGILRKPFHIREIESVLAKVASSVKEADSEGHASAPGSPD